MAVLFVIIMLAALVGVFKPYVSGIKRWQFGAAAFAAFVLVGVFAPKEGASTSSSGAPNRAADQRTNEVGRAAVVTSGWRYSEDKDEMRGAVTRYANLDANQSIHLNFPYGEQTPRITIRQSPQFGFHILVGVPSGQVMCNSWSNSHISVKFDDGPIQRYGCNDAADGSSNMVFIEGAKGFLTKLRKSKKAVIEAEFFQNGMQQMTFDTANLDWQ